LNKILILEATFFVASKKLLKLKKSCNGGTIFYF